MGIILGSKSQHHTRKTYNEEDCVDIIITETLLTYVCQLGLQ